MSSLPDGDEDMHPDSECSDLPGSRSLGSGDLEGVEHVLTSHAMHRALIQGGFDSSSEFDDDFDGVIGIEESDDMDDDRDPYRSKCSSLDNYGGNLFLSVFLSDHIVPASNTSRRDEITLSYKLHVPMATGNDDASKWVKFFRRVLHGSADDVRADLKHYATYASADSQQPPHRGFAVRAYCANNSEIRQGCLYHIRDCRCAPPATSAVSLGS
jgi:hypothetical protein